MEDWEGNIITQLLPELIQKTNCTNSLITKLQANKLLSGEEVREILEGRSGMNASRRLYEILPTRAVALDKLIAVLNEENQSGAVAILQCQQHKHLKALGAPLVKANVSDILGKGRHKNPVFRGTFLDRNVAVKSVDVRDQEQAEIQREINFLKQLDVHDNIVRYFWNEARQDVHYIILELCAHTLKKEMKINKFNQDPEIILHQCTRGMAFLHHKNIIHGDIRPANVLLNEIGQIRIADFGSSENLHIKPSGNITIKVLNVVDWMAPEILQAVNAGKKQQVTFQTDVFSLGCLFYFVLTKGKHPFGELLLRTYNILNNFVQDNEVEWNEWKNLFRNMISPFPKKRPRVEDILKIAKFKTICHKGF